jgi:hypothetical protein
MPGENEPHIRGVRILIHKNIKDALLEWKLVSEQIITAWTNTKFRKMTVVQCYAPTENANLEENKAFYNHLDRHISAILLMGDFNAQAGNDNQDIEDVMRKHRFTHRNENG